jgi:acyl carrier protein
MKVIDETAFLKMVEGAFEQRVAGVTLETSFRDLPEWDSLASVMVVAEVYADYGVHISGAELEACHTLAHLKRLIEGKL